MSEECFGQTPTTLPQLLTGLPAAVPQQVREFFGRSPTPRTALDQGGGVEQRESDWEAGSGR